MPAGHYDLTIEQGTDWNCSLQYLQDDEATPVDLTGYTARAQFRTLDTDGVSTVVKATLSTSDNSITIDATTGTIVLKQTKEQTGAYDFTVGTYDLLLSSPSNTQRLIEGRVNISPATTLPEDP